jgi:WD40 repeat protein
MCFTLTAAARGGTRPSDALIAKLDCPDRVKDVAFSPDGRLLAAGYGWNDQGGARIWNVADRTVVATLKVGGGDDANVEGVAFSPDGRWFAAANRGGDVILWPVGSWGSHKIVLARRGTPKSLAFPHRARSWLSPPKRRRSSTTSIRGRSPRWECGKIAETPSAASPSHRPL